MIDNKRVIGFVAGCFDSMPDNLPHQGHLHLLKTAKELCNYLIVGCNSDSHIRNKKNREPLTTQSKRIEALYQTGLVDEVIPFESDPLPWILFLMPDLIFTGNDYQLKDVVGWPECRAWGGGVFLVGRVGGYSTSKIIQELNENKN